MAESKEVVKQALRDSIKGKEKSVYSLGMKLADLGAKITPHKLILNVTDKLL